MAIYITGDTHGEFSRFTSKRFPQGRELTKKDFVIITGDFGGVWDVNESRDSERHWIKWLSDKPWTTLFVDGNHENFDRLEVLPTIEMFGGEVGVVSDSIFHLKRGEIYIINGKKFFTFGGGFSIDKSTRTENISWWRQEMPSYLEYQKGLNNLDLNNHIVDYIITHTCSVSQFTKMAQRHNMIHKIDESETPLREYFEIIDKSVAYDKWFCGHFHVREKIDKIQFLYGDIVELKA